MSGIVSLVKAAGVVGAGGAGFPTHIKLSAKADIVIANGAECEPLLRAHQYVMRERAEEVVQGLVSVMNTVQAAQGFIAIKKKHQETLVCLEKAIRHVGDKRIGLAFLPDFYPAGDEQVVVYEITGRIVPEGGIPLHVGVVVLNVETLLNITNSLRGTAVTHKYVTVTGAVQRPITVHVPLGTCVSELIALAGGSTVSNYEIIDGGPMMGKIIDNDAVITKTTGGIIVLPHDHYAIVRKKISWNVQVNRAKAVCCNCRACTDSCPRYLLGHGLEPHKIMQAISGGLKDSSILTRALICSECGACESFACVMDLSPRAINSRLKKEFSQHKIKNPHNFSPLEVRKNRKYHQIPSKRLISRLGLVRYDVAAPFLKTSFKPDHVRLLLSQHIGPPSIPCVKPGDFVTTGQLVAVIPEGTEMGANLHASISGIVYHIEKYVGIKESL